MGTFSEKIRKGSVWASFLAGVAACMMATVPPSALADDSLILEGTGVMRKTVRMTDDMAFRRLVTRYMKIRFADDSGNWASDLGWEQPSVDLANRLYLTPYYGSVSRDEPAIGVESEADMTGVMAGFDHQAGNLLLGLYMGYGTAGADYSGTGYDGSEEDQDLFSLGFNIMGERDGITWRGQVSGFLGGHEYAGMTGANLTQPESAEYDTRGISTALMLGRLFTTCCGEQLLPEAGLEVLWLYREEFTTATENAAYAVLNESVEEHEASAVATLTWLGGMDVGGVEMTSSLSAGVRYLLSDDIHDAYQSVGGAPRVLVETDQNKIAGTATASLMMGGEKLAAELGAAGEFGDETLEYNGWLRLLYRF